MPAHGRASPAPPASIATSIGCCGASDPETSSCSTRWISTASPPTHWSKPNVAAVVNASPSISGRYPNLGPEVLVDNGVTLIDETGPEVFKKVKDGARVRLHDGGVYAGDRRLVLGTERTDDEIHELMHEAKSGLVAHLEAFAGNTIEFIRSESPLLIDGIGIPDIDVDLHRRHVVIVAEEPDAADDLKALKPFIKEYQPVLVGVGSGADVLRKAGYRPAAHRRRSGAR